MIEIKVVFSNGDSLKTKVKCTFVEAKNHYLGNTFNIGSVNDNIQSVVSVELLNSNGEEN